MEEIWKDIEEAKGLYQVSNKGRIKSLERIIIRSDNKPYTSREKILKQQIDKVGGYYMVTLRSINRTLLVSRLVAIAFIPNPSNKEEVNHKLGDKSKNSTEDLEWTTPVENMRHAFDNKLNSGKLGEINGAHKLTEEEVLEIRELYNKKKAYQRELAKAYGVSTSQIQNIIYRKHWNHI